MELQEALVKRRSVRKFTDAPVSEEQVRELLEAARIAPSWANTQVWEFVVVRDRALIEKVAGTFSEKNPATKGALLAPVLIVACARTGISGCHKGREVTRFKEWFMFDLGMAVQNLWLKAHEMGLGTVTVGLLDHEACARILEVPAGCEVVAVLPVGQPLNPDKPGPPRKPVDEFVHREKF